MRFIHPRSAAAQTSRADWLIGAALVVIFILVALVSTLEKAFGVGMTVGILAAVVQAKWSSRRDPRMWVLIGAVGAVQLTGIFLIRIPRFTTGLIFAPFAIVEVLALSRLLNWMERRVPRTTADVDVTPAS